MERLQKFMARSGIASRRKCEEYIAAGFVTVNGTPVTELGTQIDPEKDEILFRGRKIEAPAECVTVALYKPEGYITTRKDQFGRPDVCQLVDIPGANLYPIGRLDYQTSGLILLTNDGDLAYALTHPKNRVGKVYEAVLRGQVSSEEIAKLARGVVLDDGYRTARAKVRLLGKVGSDNSRVEFTLYEGKNHQVRRMARAVGHPVLRLKRTAEGCVDLTGLSEGQYRVLSEKEVAALKREANK